MAKRHFDAVFIDFFGTVAAGDRAAVEATCRRIVDLLNLPIDARAFAIHWGEVFFATIEGSNHKGFRTLYECELISLAATLKEYDVEADPAPLVAPLERYWRCPGLHPEAEEALRRIDLPTCCVSNADRRPLEQALEHHGFHFDEVICSEDVRSYKPDPLIFEKALERMGAPADRVAHVGDSLHSDVGGASKLGITTIWVCRDDRVHDIGKSKPDYMIRSLAELPAVLNSHAG
ncbi:MAG: HAD family hydrolase [Phycisphaerales bacterium]|nr:MAG: HAD family hydrolase [Phycisphaerales bacterium]